MDEYDPSQSERDARHELYAVLNDRDHSLEEKQKKALSIGRSYLDVGNGYIQRHEPTSDTDTITCSVGRDPELFAEGTILDRSTSYCRRTIKEHSPVALSNVPEQGWEDDVAYKKHGLDCYLGTTIFTEGDVYGTVCFVSRDAKEADFTTDEKLFVELLARLLGRELEASELEKRLTAEKRAKARRNQLIAVLQRVLRHNIRNDMTTIGGLANVIAERTEDDITEIAERIETKADDLAALSEKAQTLERTINETESVGPRSLSTDIEMAIQDLKQEFPDEEFRFEWTDVPKVLATEQLRLALYELGENAARYANGSPIRYTVAADTEGVVVQVKDQGPGLPEHERTLLETGRETPLEHGTGLGLWVVNWVASGFDGDVTTTVDDGTTVRLHLQPATERE